MARIISGKEAAALLQAGDRIMISGFLVVGAPTFLIDSIIESKVEKLHVIGISTDYDHRGLGKLITSGQTRSLQLSYIGSHKLAMELYAKKEITIEFIPQGVLQERIRAAGAGLGGIFSPVGVGTPIAEGKETIIENNKTYILERPIHADYAFIRAKTADKYGNIIYSGTGRNSNTVMAMAGKTTIVEVDNIVEPGDLDPENIHTPGIFIDYIVKRPNGMEE